MLIIFIKLAVTSLNNTVWSGYVPYHLCLSAIKLVSFLSLSLSQMHKLVFYHVEHQSNSHYDKQMGCLHKFYIQYVLKYPSRWPYHYWHRCRSTSAVILSFAITCMSLPLYPPQSELSLYWTTPT
jgi:hypothetical protein